MVKCAGRTWRFFVHRSCIFHNMCARCVCLTKAVWPQGSNLQLNYSRKRRNDCEVSWQQSRPKCHLFSLHPRFFITSKIIHFLALIFNKHRPWNLGKYKMPPCIAPPCHPARGNCLFRQREDRTVFLLIGFLALAMLPPALLRTPWSLLPKL